MRAATLLLRALSQLLVFAKLAWSGALDERGVETLLPGAASGPLPWFTLPGQKKGEPEGSPSTASLNQPTRTTASERTGCCAARRSAGRHNRKRHPSRLGCTGSRVRTHPG